MKKTFAFYISSKFSSSALLLPLPGGGVCFIRVEDHGKSGVSKALSDARPRKSESLMNTYDLKVSK